MVDDVKVVELSFHLEWALQQKGIFLRSVFLDDMSRKILEEVEKEGVLNG
jgi:hypothetical protein